MDKKKIIFLSLIILLFAAMDSPKHPEGVPFNAKWNQNFQYWSSDGQFLGDFKMWYKTGVIMVNKVKVDDNHLKEISFYENGKIRVIGQNILLENKYRTGRERFEWRAYGKWKEYNEKGTLINELCYTQVFSNEDGEWNSEYCGEEIQYKDDGSVKEKIRHDLKCKYGCDELEYK